MGEVVFRRRLLPEEASDFRPDPVLSSGAKKNGLPKILQAAGVKTASQIHKRPCGYRCASKPGRVVQVERIEGRVVQVVR